MKKVLITMFAVLVSAAGKAQVKEKDSLDYNNFQIEIGMRMPLGKLADKFGPSPEFGLWYRSKIAHNDNLDIGITLYAPMEKQHFDYVEADTLYRIKAKGVSGMFGVRFSKFYQLPGRHNKTVEWVTSYGYGFFSYHDKPGEIKDKTNPPQPDPEPDKKNEIVIEVKTYTKAFSTVSVGQGIRFNIGQFGLLAQYSYTPYGLFSRNVPKDFGSHSLTMALSCKL